MNSPNLTMFVSFCFLPKQTFSDFCIQSSKDYPIKHFINVITQTHFQAVKTRSVE